MLDCIRCLSCGAITPQNEAVDRECPTCRRRGNAEDLEVKGSGRGTTRAGQLDLFGGCPASTIKDKKRRTL